MNKPVASLAALLVSLAGTVVLGTIKASADPVVCVSASAQVTVNDSPVVDQAVAQCTP